MDPTRDLPWTEHEKVLYSAMAYARNIAPPLTTANVQVYLLAEILKAAPVPSHVLINFIKDNHIQPRWEDTALPPGMSSEYPTRKHRVKRNKQ